MNITSGRFQITASCCTLFLLAGAGIANAADNSDGATLISNSTAEEMVELIKRRHVTIAEFTMMARKKGTC